MPRRSADFIGRTEQLGVLLAALDRVEAGSSALAVVSGEAGIGKTRLVDRFAALAQARGVPALRGWGVPVAGAGVAYGALASLLLDAVRRRPGLVAFVRDHAPHAAHLLPATPGLDDAPPLHGELAQLRLLEAVRSVLAELTRTGPIVAIIEDVHWIDASSGEALALLGGPGQPAGMLLVLTYRPHDLPPRHPLFAVLRELERRPHADRIDLSPFDDRELAEQAEQLLGMPPTADVLTDLAVRSGGNPFFAEELLAAWQRGDLGIPATVADLLSAELDALPDPVRRLVRTAAAAGRELHPDLLAASLELDEETVTQHIRTAAEAGVLAPTHNDRITFRHELLREAAYASLLPGERRLVHIGLARALERAPDLVEGERTAGELAYHWHLGGEPRPALAAAVQAVGEARAVGALTEAVRHGTRCLEVWDAVPNAAETAGFDRVDLLLRLAEDCQLGGRQAADGWARAALDLIDPAADPARHAVVAARLARFELTAGRLDAALATVRRAAQIITDVPEGPATARVIMDHAQILTSFDYCEDAHREALAAQAVARRVGDRVVEVEAGGVLGVSMVMAGRWVDGLTVAAAATKAAADLDAVDRAAEARAQVHVDEAFALFWTGFLQRALDVARDGIDVTGALGLERSFGEVLTSVAATAAVNLGELSTADDLLAGLRWSPLARYAGCVAEARVALALARDDIDAAEHILRLHPPRAVAQIGLCLTGAAEIALAHDRIDEARTVCTRLLGQMRALNLTWAVNRITVVALQAEALAALKARLAGDRPAVEDAVERTARLLAISGEIEDVLRAESGDLHPDARAWSSLARAWAAEARNEAHPATWDEAVAAAEAGGLRLVAADARLRAAQAYLAAGARGRAADLVTDALTFGRTVGAHGVVRRAEDLTRAARLDPGREPQQAATSRRLGLTDRELQVLRLVADGRTNREIGETLFMSPKTASVHVTNLLRKLEVTNRRDAGRIARQLGLT